MSGSDDCIAAKNEGPWLDGVLKEAHSVAWITNDPHLALERIAQLERDLAAAEEAIRIARRGWFLHDAPHDWERLPAVLKALEGAR